MANFLNILCIIGIIFSIIHIINSNSKTKLVSSYKLALSLNNLNPLQLKSLNIITISDNITNILDNTDVTNIDFSNYYPNELLFLTKEQVQSLSTEQLLTISNINIHSITNSVTGITSIYNKLSFIQLQNLASSEKYYVIPYNRLSTDTFSKLLKSLPISKINQIISTRMFLNTLPLEHFKIISAYIKPKKLVEFESLIKNIISQLQVLIDSVPPLPEPTKLESGEYDTNLETNGQMFAYLPIIFLLSSPILLSKIKNDPIKILKSLPKIIVTYLIPTTVTALYFIDLTLSKLFNDADLIKILSDKDIYTYKEMPKNYIINYLPLKIEIKPLTLDEVINLSDDELLNFNKVQLSSILLNLSPRQLVLLDIIPMNDNINFILNNKDLSQVNFKNYKKEELLFLSTFQVQNLYYLQLKTIKENLEKKGDIVVIINKLKDHQLKYLLSISDYLFPLNKLSIHQLNIVPKDYFINMPKTLPTSILSLDQNKFDEIKHNFNNEQIDNYYKYIDNIINNIIEIDKNINNDINNDVKNNVKNDDIILLYITMIILFQQIGNRLVELNIDPVEFLKKLPFSLKNKLTVPSVDIEKLGLLDSYSLNLFNDADLIPPF
jgi:hypothetical protein